jgi:hypothetical protein
VISSREQAAVAQAARLPREVRRTIASPLKLRGRATHLLEREDDALGSGFSMLAATQRTSPRAAASNQTQREQQDQRKLRQSSKMGACVAAEQQHYC